MSRMPVAAFGALILATVGAFFVAQHLKVTTPLIAGGPRPFPAAISPNENGCGGFNRYTRFSFYLLHRADDVAVYVVDQSGAIIRTLASGRHMRRGIRNPDGDFPWDGRDDNGQIAPDGTYYFRIALLQQGRTIELTKTPIQLKSAPPHPVVTGVVPSLIPRAGNTQVVIHFTGVGKRGATVRIYRTDLPGNPRLVKSFGASGTAGMAVWDGKIRRRPAPAGIYLIGLDASDSACNVGHFPPEFPPPRGSTKHAGLTVRYLAAQPPFDAVPAGSDALVYVDSRHDRYTWKLQRAGARGSAAHGSARGFALAVRLPGRDAGLYELSLRSANHLTAVPLIARANRSAPAARVLVVLPVLSWQGQNPVDDDGDGLPDTLDAGGPIELKRPLANGLPAGLADESAFLAYLDRARLPYDLTSDIGLIDRSEPPLSAYRGVVFAGSERWLPPALGASLRSYVQNGGRLLSVGVDSMRRGVEVRGDQALAPTAPAATDALGARPGPLVARNKDLITVLRDGLGIFSGTSGALGGFGSYQTFASVGLGAHPITSAAGTSNLALSIIGYRLGRGIVVEMGLPGFGASLARNIDSQELIGRLWAVLSR